jgi:hypothetical protein
VRILLVAVVAVIAGSCTSATGSITSATSTAFPSAGPLSHARISALWLFPYPEGPPGYFCPHPEQRIGISTCLRLHRSDVTGALGKPLAWPAPTPSNQCQMGWTMKVIFVDHTRLLYGPCEHPPSIDALRVALFQDAGPN